MQASNVSEQAKTDALEESEQERKLVGKKQEEEIHDEKILEKAIENQDE